MPKITITESCSRCPREEHSEVSLDEAIAKSKNPVPKAKALELVIDGKVVITYGHLCEECRGIVATYADGMKPQDKKSARRFKRVSTMPEAPDESPVSATSRPPPRRAGHE